jgi:DNA-binding CsgD family transcriptional regulator
VPEVTELRPAASGARLVGRDAELARVERFIASAAHRGSRALLVRGEAGIGKTLIWRSVLDRVRTAGHLVLVTRPAEEELQASMVGLLDLFEDLDAELVPATVLDRDTDLFDRGRAVLDTLRRLADDRTVVLAIDDLQWLDPISRRSLRYALRRLEDLPVLLLATERTGAGDGDAMPLVPPERTEVITVGALPIEAIRQVLTPVMTAISRPALELVHELSAGNPMYALELARSSDLNRDRLAMARTSSGQTLDRALSARLAGAPPDVRLVVQTVAALGPASPERLRAACGEPAAAGLNNAIGRGLLALDDSLLVRCSHPLVGSVALGDMEAGERRAVHGHLAEIVTDPDERARHVALATIERDAAAAAEVEDAANRAGRRGAPALAAELAAHSLRLTPVDDRTALARRAVAEILHRKAAGEAGRAIAMIDAIVAGLPPGPERFAALGLRVGIDYGSAEEVLARAHEEAEADELVRGRIQDMLGYMTYMYRGELDRGRELETEALGIALRHGDAELEMLSSAALAMINLLSGDPQPDLFARALELGRQVQNPRHGRWPDVDRGRQAVWGGYLDEAREVFTRLQATTVQSGLEFQRPFRAFDLAQVELAAGRLGEAAELVDDGLESALDAGTTSIAMWLRYVDGLAHAHAGLDEERVRRDVEAMRAWGLEHGELTRALMAHHVAGVLALTQADGSAALAELLEGVALGRRLGFAHPGVVPMLPDAIEAAVAIGAADVATDLATELDSQAAALRLPWVDATALRGRGLAAMAAGDKLAAGSLAAAVAAFDRLGYRLDAARASLWHGRALLRTGRRAPAADVLADARDRLETLDARPWVAQAAADLERVAPGRATGALTEDEARIAALVSAGRRNREIAAELYVSVATVEAHLTRIYRKLDVRSRTELSRRLLESPTPAPAPSGTVGT